MTTIESSAPPASRKKADLDFLRADWRHLVAQGLGSGLSPIMPGTAGTFFGWLIYAVFSTVWPETFTPGLWTLLIICGFALGVYVCEVTGQNLNSPDDGSMVWDEIIAFWAVLLIVGPNFFTQLWAFIWFRFFDMVKPAPIKYFDQKMKGGLGVMWDDIVAAFYTLLLFAVWHRFTV